MNFDKPFAEYKWRWLSTTPTEGLLNPPVFLGVLRAFGEFNGAKPSDTGLLEALRVVQAETGTNVDLVRTPARNLVRNSGQYWKGTGLIKTTRGEVELSRLGWRVARSEISQDQFASFLIQQTELPSKSTFPEELYEKWREADLKIKPFALILRIMVAMGKSLGNDHAYLTVPELTDIVIPLAGIQVDIPEYVQKIQLYRLGELDLSGWPDCTPAANDKRMAREFLYFLVNFGVCKKLDHPDGDRFMFVDASYVNELDLSDGLTLDDFKDDDEVQKNLEALLDNPLPELVERQRAVTTVLKRNQQSKFRRKVLSDFRSTCLITGVTVEKVLEAAHIIPVNLGGSDELDNGLCLRIDIHRLFDASLLKINADGRVDAAPSVLASTSYDSLPSQVSIPQFVNLEHLHWRIKYC